MTSSVAGPASLRLSNAGASCVAELQHTPSVHMADPHHIRESNMLFPHQPLCQDISYLISSGNIHKIKFFIFYLLPQEVVPDFNMLGAIMEFQISRDGNGRLVVHGENGGFFNLLFQFD